MIKNFFKGQEGQTATEYMLIISVVVIAVVAAAYTFVPTFQAGVSDLANDVKTILAHGKIGSAGTSRN
jgi:Flp pilus assembly pilin Flp